MAYRVPFVDPREHYRRYKTEIDEAITGTIRRLKRRLAVAAALGSGLPLGTKTSSSPRGRNREPRCGHFNG